MEQIGIGTMTSTIDASYPVATAMMFTDAWVRDAPYGYNESDAFRVAGAVGHGPGGAHWK
jgi:hypothetical protein